MTTPGMLLVQLLFTALWALLLVGWFSWPASKANSKVEGVQWAKAYGLEVTQRNWPMINYYVKLAITLRVIGGVGGLVLGSLFDDATGLDTSAGAGFWVWIVLGWLVGASWAEYRLTRPPSAGQVASLTPRDVGDYLSPRMYAAPVVAAAVAVALAVGLTLAPEPDASDRLATGADPLARPALVVAGVGAILIAGLVRLAVRAVIARRQPTGPADIVAADDAIRASAVHHLAGGGTAAILFITAQLAFSGLSPYQLPFGLRGWVPAILVLAAFVAWRFYAYRHWRVRRADRLVARR